MPYDAALFDLDGTLLDTLADLSAAANHALTTLGRPTHPREAYNTFLGQGVRELFVDALGPDHQHLIDDAIHAHLAYYADHRLDTTGPFPGIDAMLDQLAQRGVKLGVLSNKPDPVTREMIPHFFPHADWAYVRGHRAGTAPKPDPHAALEAIDTLGIPADRWLYVGDTAVDMQTGKGAGMFTVGVSWGFRSVEELRAHGADAIVDDPAELVALLEG
ncbi:MAG: HAD family hydrolase [Phycisphaerales bacterium JB063]